MAEEKKEKPLAEEIGFGDPFLLKQLQISEELTLRLRSNVRDAVAKLDFGSIVDGSSELTLSLAGGKVSVTYRTLRMKDHRRLAYTTRDVFDALDETEENAYKKLPEGESLVLETCMATLAHTVVQLNGKDYPEPQNTEDLMRNAQRLQGLPDRTFWLVVAHYYWFQEFANRRMSEDELKNG